MRKHREGVDEVIQHLTVLRDAWAAMLHKDELEPVQPAEGAVAALATA